MSQIDDAIAFIRKKGSARTDEIAEALNIKASLVSVILNAPAKDGRLVSCRVERPGRMSCNEYRIGGGMPATPFNPTLAASTPVRRETKPAAVETKPASAETKPAAVETKPASAETKPAAAETPPPKPVPAAELAIPTLADLSVTPGRRIEHTAQQLVVSIDSDGCAVLRVDHLQIHFNLELTRRLGKFVASTEPAWS